MKPGKDYEIVMVCRGSVKMYECGLAILLKGYAPQDILPWGRIVVSGIGAIIDLEKSGDLSITP